MGPCLPVVCSLKVMLAGALVGVELLAGSKVGEKRTGAEEDRAGNAGARRGQCR